MRWLPVALGLISLLQPHQIPFPVVRLEKLEQEDQSLVCRWYLEDFPDNDDWAISYEAELWNSALPGHCSYRHVQAALVNEESKEIVVGERENGHKRCRELIHIQLAPPRLDCQITHLHNKLTAPPLFGSRVITLESSRLKLHADCLYSPIKKILLSPVPEERLDSRHFLSPPNALYLSNETPGFNSFHFKDVIVKGGQQITIGFNYRQQGSGLRARLSQYHDTPHNWKKLEIFDKSLPANKGWTKFEEKARLHQETTSIALDFRLTKNSSSQVWIDEIEITQQDPYLIPGPDYRQWYEPLKD